jgi:hypothetical protein
MHSSIRTDGVISAFHGALKPWNAEIIVAGELKSMDLFVQMMSMPQALIAVKDAGKLISKV